ncbi:MAG: S8 family serine peptidase [Candidatus Obscuribacterales bacterium]|nr:S8 family serine peptidase [Candidatus Obscuribacterales bacterium]
MIKRARVWSLWSVLTFSLISLFTSQPGFCQSSEKFELKLPQQLPTQRAQQTASYEDDLIMISPNPGADKDDISDALKEVHGTIVHTFGADGHIVYVVKTEKGKLAETEKTLGKDKNFHGMQRCYRNVLHAVSVLPAPNDPVYAQEWHLRAMQAITAWNISQGAGQIIGVIDTGVNASGRDLSGKVYQGFNGITYSTNTTDNHGHGTMVSTTAAAITNNGFGIASPACRSYIYPTCIAMGNYISEIAIVNSIYNAGSRGVKILNISAGPSDGSFGDKSKHPALHEALQWFYSTKGGLCFIASGNSGYADRYPRQPYMMLVSAIDSTGMLSSFSNYGNTTWFTAPGRDIFCIDNKDRQVVVAGTSFSAPLCAAAAAMVWSVNPRLKNYDVQNILTSTCLKAANSPSWNIYYGFGLPNIDAAVAKARLY